MTRQTPQHVDGGLAARICLNCGCREVIEPINISVKETARLLNLKPWTVYNQILDRELVASGYFGKRRLVNLQSLREFAANLPPVKPEDS